jgi:putative lipoprotein
MSPIALRRAAFACCLMAAAGLSACDGDPPPGAAEAPPAADAPQPPHGAPAPGGEPISPQPWDDARDRGAALRGIGQEPGWTVEVFPGDRIVYLGDYGEHHVTAPAGTPRQEGGRTTWDTSADGTELRVVFEELPCTDVMSGEEFPLTVTLTVDGREFRGCGRRLN